MSLFDSLFKGNDTTSKTIESPVELATYAGSLASNPSDIDPMLDRVRKITTLHAVDSGISPNDEAELLDVYLDLEKYLTTSDPIRTFTKDELRNRLSPDLLTKLTTQEAKGVS